MFLWTGACWHLRPRDEWVGWDGVKAVGAFATHRPSGPFSSAAGGARFGVEFGGAGRFAA